MIYIIGIVGILIGSFLNVCISRIPKKENIAYPPSHCTSCNNKLKSIHLIPVISYFLLKGKCAYCDSKISIKYPLVEILNMAMYILLFLKFSMSILFLKYAILSSILIVISFIDYEHMIIPDEIIIFGFIIFFIMHFSGNFKDNIIKGSIALLIGGGLFLLIAVITKGAMGGGDIKLMALLGFVLGIKKIIIIILLSFIIGSIISIILIILKIKSRKDYIPFGPFISTAAVIAMMYSSDIINWYIYSVIN